MIKNNYTRKLLISLLISTFGLFFSQIAMATLQATVDKTEVQLGQMVTLNLVTNDDIDFDIIDLNVLKPNFKIGSIYKGYNFSSSNGKRESIYTLSVTLFPNKLGTLTIPVFTISGQSSQEIKVKVLPKTKSIAAQQNFWIEANLDKKQIYLGELVTYRARYFFGASPNNLQIMPPKSKYGSIIVDSYKDIQQARVVKNGRAFLMLEREYKIFANKSGNISIDGTQMNADLQSGVAFSFVPVEAQAKSLNLNILEKPHNYNGFWLPSSNVSLTETWQGNLNHLKVGDSITRNIKLIIRDQPAKRFPDINLKYPDNVKVYSDKPQFEVRGYDTIMTMHQVLIARSAGNIKLDKFELPWWNSISQKEEKELLPEKILSIMPNLNPNEQIGVYNITNNFSSINKIGFDAKVDKKDTIYLFITTLLVIIFCLLWLITLFLYYQLKKKNEKNIINTKPEENNINSSSINFLNALENKNINQIQILYPNWLEQQKKKSFLDMEKLAKIDNLIKLMLANNYSQYKILCDEKELICFVKEIEDINIGKKSSKLADIVPR